MSRGRDCSDQPPALVLEGIELFNRGEFFECHEALEEAWRAEGSGIRYLYQGILQIGVGFHHLRTGNWRGADALLRRGIEKVARFEPVCLGIDTARLNAAARRCQAVIQFLGPERMSEFDWSLVPRVEFIRPPSN